jgi:predicted phage terminase large subunit-like protein
MSSVLAMTSLTSMGKFWARRPPGEDILGQYRNHWLVFKRGCYNASGEPYFPVRFNKSELEGIKRNMGTFLFSAQYMNEPVPSDSQMFPLPLIQKAFVKEHVLPKIRTKFTTLDLAMSQASDADRTAIVTCSVCMVNEDPRPKLVIEHIASGHFKPLETVDKMFQIYKEHRPLNIRTEDVAFQRLLAPIVQMEGARRGLFLPMIWMKRDNREAKEARIASLQAWFERCDILILDSIPHKEELVLELTRFPKYKRNDIIDALADQLMNVNPWTTKETNLPDIGAKCGDARVGML